MPVDYNEVLREIDAQIAFHEGEIETLRTGRPAIVKMRNATIVGMRPSAPPMASGGRFSGLGNQAAVRLLMADGQLRSRDEIYDELRNGGFTSDAANPVGSIGATLSQMKDELERVEDRWRKRTTTTTTITTPLQAWGPPTTEDKGGPLGRLAVPSAPTSASSGFADF